MFRIPVRRAIANVMLLLLITLEAGSCGERPKMNPHVHPPKTAKNQRLVPCDTTINVDLNNGAYPLAAFLCENDTVTWQTSDQHHFTVQFNAGSPFVGGQTTFDDLHPSGTVKPNYDRLDLYKYTITIDNTKVFDPEVVGGGNP